MLQVFERRTSLFSLTITSVLIINMWMNDIGRFHAANMGLLKTIFEMNLQLFKENQVELIFNTIIFRWDPVS